MHDALSRNAWRFVAVAAFGFGGAFLGLSAGAPSAQASTTPTRIMDSWACNSSDRCGPGSKACCSEEAGQHCSTTCPIIIY